MAKCVRKGCNRPVSPIPEAKAKRLCKKHYERFCELKERKENHLVYQNNKQIPRIIKRTRKGRTYYTSISTRKAYVKKKSDVEHAGLIKKAREKIIKVMKSSAWRNTENRIRQIRTTEELSLSLSDVMELYRLYSWVNYCKHDVNYSKTHLNSNPGNLKLQLYSIPALKYQPNGLLQHLIVIPEGLKNTIINKSLRVKKTKNKYEKHNYPSLYKTLVKQYGIFHATIDIINIPMTYPYHPSSSRSHKKLNFENTLPPLFDLLKNELIRLKVIGKYSVMSVFETTYRENQFTLELVSIYLLTRICCNGIKEFYEFSSEFVKFNEGKSRIELPPLVELELQMKGYDYFINLYNSMFTHEIITYIQNDETLRITHPVRYITTYRSRK